MVIFAAHSRRRIQYCLLNLVVTAAAAQITGQVGADLLYRRSRIFFQKALGAQNKSGRAIRTLKSVMIDKGLLNRMEFTGITQSLDGHDRLAFSQRREQKTRAYRLAIQKHGACAAHADAATFAGAKELEFIAQHFEQTMMSVHGLFFFDSVDCEFDDLFHVLPRCPSSRVLRKAESCFESLSTNGFYKSFNLFPFRLELVEGL